MPLQPVVKQLGDWCKGNIIPIIIKLMEAAKFYKGEKYIYLLMAYKLAKQDKNTNTAKIGNDSGVKGGQNYERFFYVKEYEGKTLLIESKISANFADFSRTFEIINTESEKPLICDYINRYGENCGKRWVH